VSGVTIYSAAIVLLAALASAVALATDMLSGQASVIDGDTIELGGEATA
jgi:endonuclease YncB( thermonuclease family)